MNDFIKPKEAVRILKISAETLRTKHVSMGIRRTLEKPFYYSKSDCLRYAQRRFAVDEKMEERSAYFQSRVERMKRKYLRGQL